MAEPEARLELDGVDRAARARIVEGDEADRARALVFEKYAPRGHGDLTGWRDRALPIAVDLSSP